MVVIQKLKLRFPACAILTGSTFKKFESELLLPALAIRRIIQKKNFHLEYMFRAKSSKNIYFLRE
jgi:hypothetical protein